MPAPPSFCENSTITEAWMFAAGIPGPLDKYGSAALAHAATEAIPGLTEKPTVTAVTGQPDVILPFWDKQFSWDTDRFTARIGHRYLSVHFSRRPDGPRYETFSKTLEPWTTKWLALYAAALKMAAPTQEVDRLGFGYANTFAFPLADFDLSDYFKLQMTVDVGGGQDALFGFKAVFGFEEATGERVTVELEAEPTDETTIGVVTKVYAERLGLDGLTFADTEKLSEVVRVVKEVAKTTFFNFATPKTHGIMGARP